MSKLKNLIKQLSALNSILILFDDNRSSTAHLFTKTIVEIVQLLLSNTVLYTRSKEGSAKKGGKNLLLLKNCKFLKFIDDCSKLVQIT